MFFNTAARASVLIETRHLAELPFQRRRHRRCHDFRTGARIKGGDLDGRVVDFRQGGIPSIFTLAIDGLGPLTGKGSGLLVTAIVGGAVIPVLQGALADQFGIHYAFILPALCPLSKTSTFLLMLVCLRYRIWLQHRPSKPGRGASTQVPGTQ
jgi:hypothetical protein